MRRAVLIFDTLFPYLTLLCVIALSKAGLWPLFVLLGLWALFLVLSIALLWQRCRGEERRPLGRITLIIKLAQIPAFIAIFIIGFLTLAFPALPLLLMLMDWLAVALTGLLCAGTVWQLHKARRLGGKAAIVLGILSFVFCADVIAAWCIWRRERKG